MIESSCASCRPAGFLNHLFYGRSSSAGEYGAAIEKAENGKSLLFLVKRGESNLFLALKR